MVTGINEQMINKLKVELLNCVASINSLYNCLDACRAGIKLTILERAQMS